MAASVSERVKRRRDHLRASGLRPVQIWVPDTRRPGFTEECRRQSILAAASDRTDGEMLDFLDAGLADIEDWK